jgi:hypothetical protein
MRGAAFFAYADNYLIDVKFGVIMDVEASRAIRQAEDTALLRQRARLSYCPLRARCCPKMPARRIPRSIYEEARGVACAGQDKSVRAITS